MDSSISPIRQPQRRMNPALKNIVKEELQKILNVGFIYPISYSKWLSPVVVVPNKVTGKWCICVDFWELNKAMLKDYFPFPFIDKVLDTLYGKQYFSFLDGYIGCNHIFIAPKDHDNTTFTCPKTWKNMSWTRFHILSVSDTAPRDTRGVWRYLVT